MILKQLTAAAVVLVSLSADAVLRRSATEPEQKGADRIVEYITSIEQTVVETQQVVVDAERRGATNEEIQLALAKHRLAKKQEMDRNVKDCSQTNGIVEFVSGGFICRYLAKKGVRP